MRNKAKKQLKDRKRRYPSFRGDVLNYFTFKERWNLEVGPEKQVESRELQSLKDNIPQAAKNKLIDCKTLVYAWKVLDHEYGDMDEIRAKLKAKITGIKIKSTNPKKEIEVFEAVTHISAQIRAIGGKNELKHDREFIALVL